MLLISAAAALWPVCQAKFVSWDDHTILYHNRSLNPPTWGSLRLWWTTPHQRLYTPVAYTVWGGLAWLARVPPDPHTGITLNPHVFHTANLLLHLLTVTVAYFLLKRLVGWRWPAAAGALLFGLHPVQVESVAHASGIQGLLCGLFSLIAIKLYVQSARGADEAVRQAGSCSGMQNSTQSSTEVSTRSRSDRLSLLYAVATAAFLLALLSKPAGVVVPLLAGVLHVLWLGGRPGAAARRLGPWLVAALVCVAWLRIVQPTPRYDVAIPVYSRPLIAGYSLAFYLYKILLPWRLGIVYAKSTPDVLLRGDVVYYTWLVPAGLTAALWRMWRNRPDLRPAAVGGLWFVAALLPVLGFTRFDFQSFSTVTDRYLYLPMFGIALCAAWLLARPWCRANPRRTALACGIVLATLAVRSHLQTRVWYDSTSLFRNAHHVNPAGGIADDEVAS